MKGTDERTRAHGPAIAVAVGLIMAVAGLTVPSRAAAMVTLSSSLDQPGAAADANITYADPPDATGAIGRQRYFEVVNDRIMVYDRTDLRVIAQTGQPLYAVPPSCESS